MDMQNHLSAPQRTPLIVVVTALLFSACAQNNDFDASGVFEAQETIISSEASGTIRQFSVEEGERLEAGQTIGFIDSTQLYLKKKQLESQIRSTLSQKPDIGAQVASLRV